MAGIRANGIDIEYEISGPKDGVPILLIHGFASNHHFWLGLYQRLAVFFFLLLPKKNVLLTGRP